jgi:double-stranded uracil-DNA glycosylase
MDRGFPPIADENARTLILGTLPGQASLAAGRYYAHPRNAFWPILGAVFGFDADAPYAKRVVELHKAGIAVWDVCAAAVRPGSLDSAIAADTIRPNDFAGFFARHPKIVRIGFNGTTAARLYRRHALPTDCHELVTLASTSPAHAAMDLAAKRRSWAVFLAGQRE